MNSIKSWISAHPNLTAWFVLALGMVAILVWEARDVGLEPMQWFWLIVVTILVGFGLNSLGVNEETGRGYVTAGPIAMSLMILTLLFFFIAWFRGAFPILGKWHPALIRFPPRDPRIGDIPYIVDKRKRFRYQELMEIKYRLVEAISKTKRTWSRIPEASASITRKGVSAC